MSKWTVSVIASLVLFGVGAAGVACQEVDGECWPATQTGAGVGAGAGGGPDLPPGWGGYGVSPEPQGADEDDELPPGCVAPDEKQGSTCVGSPVAAGGTTFAECEGSCRFRCSGVNGFSPGAFKFMTTIPDDGTGTPGGWQEANVSLAFKSAYPAVGARVD